MEPKQGKQLARDTRDLRHLMGGKKYLVFFRYIAGEVPVSLWIKITFTILQTCTHADHST